MNIIICPIKQISLLRTLLGISLLLISLACEKWDYDAIPFLTVTTEEIIDKTSTSATLVSSYSILSEGVRQFNVAQIEELGHLWWTTTTQDTFKLIGTLDSISQGGKFTFTSTLTNVSAQDTIIFQAFVKLNDGRCFHAANSLGIRLPGITTVLEDFLSILSNQITVAGRLLGINADVPAKAHGFCWSQENSLPTILDDTINLGPKLQSDIFIAQIEKLENATFYHIRPYAIYDLNGLQVKYGSPRRFRIDDVWERIPFANIEVNRRHLSASFVINGKAYLGSGIGIEANQMTTRDIVLFDDLFEFDPTTEAWKRLSFDNRIVFRYAASGFAIGHTGYICGGLDRQDQPLKTLAAYNTTTGQWQVLPDFPGTARYGATVFVINEKAYYGLGFDASANALKDFWEFDPNQSNPWRKVNDFAGPSRGFPVSFVINNKAYLVTGFSTPEGGPLQDFWQYDPLVDSWLQLKDFPGKARGYAVGLAIDQKGFLGTGTNQIPSALKDFWEYAPTTDTWQRRKDLEGNFRYGATAFALNNKGYIGLGTTSAFGLTAEFEDWWAYIKKLNN